MNKPPHLKRKLSGWLIVNKPEGMRSTPLTSQMRRLFGAAKAGHAGTLDEQACGLLAIAFGEATKTIPFLVAARKTYRFTLRWGIATDSHDRDGKVLARSHKTPSRQQVEALLPHFTGEIKQIPPDFSAVRRGGERAWRFAHRLLPADDAPPLTARRVEVMALRLCAHSPSKRTSELLAQTGKGVYIRALARDLSESLAMPAYVSRLQREQLGDFTLADGYTPAQLEQRAASAPPAQRHALLDACLQPVARVLRQLPHFTLTRATAIKLRSGQAIPLCSAVPDAIPLDLARNMGEKKEAKGLRGEIALALCQESPVALVVPEAGQLKPVKVFNL